MSTRRIPLLRRTALASPAVIFTNEFKNYS